MALNTFSSASLVAAIDEKATLGGLSYFRDRFFTGRIFSRTHEIHFDLVDKARRLAPYVSPKVQGKMVEHLGFTTRMFKPPYLKPKSIIDPSEHLTTRMPGEPIGGSLDLSARRDMLVDETLGDHDDMIAMREEVQAIEALRLGQVSVSGEGYPDTVLSYGRAAALTVTLAGAAKWDQAGVDVLADLEAWADLVFQNGGGVVREWYMGTDAWTSFLARLTTEQKDRLFDGRRSSMSQAEFGPRTPDYIKFRGSWGDFDLFTVSQTYQDEDGNDVQLVPTAAVFGAAPDTLEGRMAYGAILDPRAGYPASVRAFPKNWINDDPAAEFLMTQSAPLAVPLRPNASFGATVQ